MNYFFPVTHSILSASALMDMVAVQYAVGQPVMCRLLSRSMNDTYLLSTHEAAYILRAYRTQWRSLSEILYECDLIDFLKQQGIAVSIPVVRRDGDVIAALEAPEGPRYIALFTYAPGHHVPLEEAACRQFGATLASMHTAAQYFASQHQRFTLDLDPLVDRPLMLIEPWLRDRPADWRIVMQSADMVRVGIAQLIKQGLDTGVCHGDVWDGNAHLSADGTVTLFDFDYCGRGWPSYDLAVFRSTVDLAGADIQVWEAFLKGYQQRRTLSAADVAALPLMVAVRRIWHMGIQVANGNDWGFGWLDMYFDRAIANLRGWMNEHVQGFEIAPA
jgi:Ser/Thr protein kinase RdoA (MazF antagonist)